MTLRQLRREEQCEAEAAPLLHDALCAVDIAVLDDPGFWRYLSLELFWDFISVA